MNNFNNAVGPQVRQQKPKIGKILPVVSVASLGLGLQSATQYAAYAFDYDPLLGSNFHHVYPIWGILEWMKWTANYPDVFMRAGGVGTAVSVLALASLLAATAVRANSAKGNPYLHGSARWANTKDIEAAGLVSRPRSTLAIATGKPPAQSTGVYVGAWIDDKGVQHYLRHDGPEHVLTYAPTRSGKGVGLVMPTLLSWPESVVITDLKGELWAMTAGWRKQHARNRVLRFEPASPHGSACWNPLDEIRIATEYEVGDVQNLATLIVDPDGKGLENHWQKTSQALLVGVILHVIYKARNERTSATLHTVDTALADPTQGTRKLWTEMAKYRHVNDQNHPVIGATGRDMLDREDKGAEEASSILSTAKSYLTLYRDPIVAKNISRSEFSITDLMNHDEPVSLYIVTTPTDKSRLRPLVRIILNMIVRKLADTMAFTKGRAVAHYRHRLLMMLDEFPAIGKLEILQESLAFLAGYGIKCYLICQDLNQLKSRETGYGPDETITSACHVQNAYPPNRLETAEHLSKLTGQTTVVKDQVTTSGKRAAAILGQVSRTVQEVQRPLLTPDECLRMPAPKKDAQGDIIEPGDMVIYVAGHPAIYGRQPLYFKDPVFLARAAVPTPTVSDRLIADVEPEHGIAL